MGYRLSSILGGLSSILGGLVWVWDILSTLTEGS